jgi:hypothetical protein
MIEISNYDLRFAEIFDQTVTKLNLMKVIPETRRVYYILYLRFYFKNQSE